jgi:hypothetical protein
MFKDTLSAYHPVSGLFLGFLNGKAPALSHSGIMISAHCDNIPSHGQMSSPASTA